MSASPLSLDLSRKPRAGERVVIGLLALCAVVSIATTVGIIAVLIFEAIEFFREVSFFKFFTGTKWQPLGDDAGDYGVLPLLGGTAMIGFGALCVGLPLGLATAIYLAEYASPRVRAILKPTLELLAGVPTVVIGFFALNFITPSLLRPVFGEDRVFIFNAASGAVAVGLMILPLIASISEDALRAVPQSLREASYGLGATKRVTALRVVVPAALSGIAASVILGLSRAVGETMAVTIAAGNTPRLTVNFFDSIQTLTAAIAQTVSGEASAGSARYLALFALGATLFVLTLGMNMISNIIIRRFRQEYQ
ncbi:MAG TPA: phosphate ABC transporter permease subunit PstC [Acidimicrobiales bacterium]|jgi:phosphate transport system permease protein|nr:phosphate ABC transporter permease subunit PstC [Acidimicrobiales bacterium]